MVQPYSWVINIKYKLVLLCNEMTSDFVKNQIFSDFLIEVTEDHLIFGLKWYLIILTGSRGSLNYENLYSRSLVCSANRPCM
jgi:hypothetical protein